MDTNRQRVFDETDLLFPLGTGSLRAELCDAERARLVSRRDGNNAVTISSPQSKGGGAPPRSKSASREMREISSLSSFPLLLLLGFGASQTFFTKGSEENEDSIWLLILRYLRFLLLILIAASGFERAVFRWSVPDKRSEFHLAGDRVRRFQFSL